MYIMTFHWLIQAERLGSMLAVEMLLNPVYRKHTVAVRTRLQLLLRLLYATNFLGQAMDFHVLEHLSCHSTM